MEILVSGIPKQSEQKGKSRTATYRVQPVDRIPNNPGVSEKRQTVDKEKNEAGKKRPTGAFSCKNRQRRGVKGRAGGGRRRGKGGSQHPFQELSGRKKLASKAD